MMRTLVKTTPFDPPILSSAIAISPPVSVRRSQTLRSFRRRVRPDMFRGEARAFLRLLDRRPMAASRQHLELSALDLRPQAPARRVGRSDRIVFAGHEQRRAAQAAEVGAPSPAANASQDWAKPSASWRRWLSRTNAWATGLSAFVDDREASRRDGVGDRDHAVPPRERGPVPRAARARRRRARRSGRTG